MMTTNPAPTVEHENSEKNPKAEIVIEHLKKSFGKNCVLEDINLTMSKGENLAVLGKSGTGKSVLIKCIVGLIEPDEGKLIIFGQDVSTLKEKELIALRKRIGFLFQSGALYDSMTVRENLEFPLKRQIHKVQKDEMDRLVLEALENVGLADAIEKTPAELSGGMRKRLGLARTLILKPEIMLYDEPTTGLDPITAKEISHLILDVQEKYKTSSIIITHDRECAKLTANRIIVIRDGKSDIEGSYSELQSSDDQWVRSFFE
jgi:phospholipid/cholesterol/gamma-HCH transport system ATP-binding protein